MSLELERRTEIHRYGEVGSYSWHYRVNNYDSSGEGEPYSFQTKFGADRAVVLEKGLPEHYILRHWNSGNHGVNHYDGSILSAKLADKIIRKKAYEYAKDHTKNVENIIDMTDDKKDIREDTKKIVKEISSALVFSP